ncbi:MAG: hypothetical protein J5750_09090 [Clostridiales bacterium]|nr:hypothetical protein [Clostridiales bacterium]
MPSKEYPKHDINQVFDTIQTVISGGGVAENTGDEMSFLNRLFAALPVEAVEYGMQFLHGRRDLPASCDEILPLYIRFVNLVEYCEIVEKMREIPTHPTPEELQLRIRMNQTLDEIEKLFCQPILGFRFNKDLPEGTIDPASLPGKDASYSSDPASGSDNPDSEGSGSALHLMNRLAPVFLCADAVKTALFYEEKLGFTSTHLDDESMPHIRICRDNIEIILISATDDALDSAEARVRGLHRDLGIYDLYIFASEPMLLQMELVRSGVKILSTLEESDQNIHTNREFVFEDIDGRRICVSQRLD